jgi:hypothetical protein
MTEPMPAELAGLGMTQRQFDEMGRAVDACLEATPPFALFQIDPLLPFGELMKRLPEEGKNGVARHHAGLDGRTLGLLAAQLAGAAGSDWDAAAKALEAADWDLEQAFHALSDPIYRAMDAFFDRMTERDRAALRARYDGVYAGNIGPLTMNLAGAADLNVEVMLRAARMAGWDLERAFKGLGGDPETRRRLRRQSREWRRAATAARRLTVRRPWWMPWWLADILLDVAGRGKDKEEGTSRS